MTAILFVDDDPNVLQAMERALFRDRKRWTMAFVDSSERALEELAGTRFDVVVTDLSMPGLDGLELLDRVRAAHPNIVRIVLTGNVERLNAERTRSVHEVLSKPYPVHALRQCLERWEATRMGSEKTGR